MTILLSTLLGKELPILAMQVFSAILLGFTGLTHYLPKSPLNPHWGEQNFLPPCLGGLGASAKSFFK